MQILPIYLDIKVCRTGHKTTDKYRALRCERKCGSAADVKVSTGLVRPPLLKPCPSQVSKLDTWSDNNGLWRLSVTLRSPAAEGA